MPPFDINERIDSLFGTGDSDKEKDDQTTAVDGDDDGASTEPSSGDDGQDTKQQPAKTDDLDASSNGGASGGDTKQPSTQSNEKQNTQSEQQGQRRLPANNRGDLVDPNTGVVVARAGNERRFFETARAAQAQLNNTARELDGVQRELNAFREAASLPRELALQPAEVTNALQWFAHWKQNPVEAAQKVLTELRTMGYEVEGMGGAVDMGAIKRLVQEAVSPFKQDRDAATREAQIAAEVDQELNTFYDALPWARNQQQELQNLLQADPTLTLREAALSLRAYAAENRLDLSKPLRDQVLAARNGEQQKQSQRVNAARTSAPTLTGDNGMTTRRANTSASHEQRNRDIVREAMREAGLNVDNL
jgi:hypothetical protein